MGWTLTHELNTACTAAILCYGFRPFFLLGTIYVGPHPRLRWPIELQPDRHRDTEGFAGRNISHHDLFSRRRGLGGAPMTLAVMSLRDRWDIPGSD